MKYAVIQCVNGNFSIVSEHEDYESARTSWFSRGTALSNADDVETGFIGVWDEYFNRRLLSEDLGHKEPSPEPVIA